MCEGLNTPIILPIYVVRGMEGDGKREILFEGEKEILFENGFGTNRLVESSRSTNGQLLMAII